MCGNAFQLRWDQATWDAYYASDKGAYQFERDRLTAERDHTAALAMNVLYDAEIAAYAEAKKRQDADDLRAMLRARKAAQRVAPPVRAPELVLA